jgi:hypothetical protein
MRRSSVDVLDEQKGGAVDTTSNVRGKTYKEKILYLFK